MVNQDPFMGFGDRRDDTPLLHTVPAFTTLMRSNYRVRVRRKTGIGTGTSADAAIGLSAVTGVDARTLTTIGVTRNTLKANGIRGA